MPWTLQQAPTNPRLRQRLQATHQSGSVSCGVTAPFSWVLGHISFCLCPPRACFLQSCASSVIKSDPLRVLSPFARSPGWEICCGSWSFNNFFGIIVLQFVGRLFSGSTVGLKVTSSKRADATGLLHPEPLPLWQATADPNLCRRLQHRS